MKSDDPFHDHSGQDVPDNIEAMLIDLHLDRISDEDRARLEAMIENDPELGRLSDQVGRSLRPLDYWTAPPMPENLVDRTLDRIALKGTPNDHAEGTGEPVELTERRGWGLPRPLLEALAVAACVGVLISAMIPSLAQVRHRSQQSECAMNLGSVFQGAALYQASFGGVLPFAGGESDTSWLPNSGGNAEFSSNSRNVYLLARLNFGPKPENFVCPSSDDGAPMKAGALSKHSDFARKANISYDTLNLSGTRPNLHPNVPIAYAGDSNPLFRSGKFNASVDPYRTNSPSHGSRGQNVLTLDGQVQWLTSPVYGTNEDNIWMAGSIRKYDGTERPQDESDAQLVPGFPVTDPNFGQFVSD